MKKKVYLDSTILSYYFDNRDSIKLHSEITKEWFTSESQNFSIYISYETIIELQRGTYPNKEKILEFIKNFEILPYNTILKDIVEVYVNNYLMPKNLIGDALHLAYTSYYGIEFLLTWNCMHLANANKKQHIRVVNSKLGISIPEIITPLELFSEEN